MRGLAPDQRWLVVARRLRIDNVAPEIEGGRQLERKRARRGCVILHWFELHGMRQSVRVIRNHKVLLETRCLDGLHASILV